MTVITERISALDTLVLKQGAHSGSGGSDVEPPECCFNEAAAWLAGEKHTDAPMCVSPVIRAYTMRLNDRWDDERRQSLLPYVARVVGTGGDGKDHLREQIAAEWLTKRLLPGWLELAGMGDSAATLEGKTGADLRSALYAIRDAAWAKWRESRAELERKIRERLTEQGKPAAVADADAVAAAVADAVADAVAAAAADAAADAVAVAVADAAAVADAVADAVAAAAADAAAVDGSVDWWGKPYSAAYKAASDYYKANPLPVMAVIEDLAAKQAPLALELLDALIDPEAVAS